MTESRVERARSSTPSFDGLTPLHLAVLQGNYAQVRKIVNEREIGVDAPTATSTTALMFAALYGRRKIFLYLLGKKASPARKDSQGNDSLDYVKQRSPFVQKLIRKYKSNATIGPDRGGRREIYVILKVMVKTIKQQSKMAYAEGRAAARHEAHAQPQPQTSAHTEQADRQQTGQDLTRRAVFLPSLDGKHQEFIEGTCTATVRRSYSKAKCIGLICAADGNDTHMFAISGWGNVNDKNLVFENTLNSREYTGLVMRLAAIMNFKLRGSAFDQSFPGTPSEKKGVFWACHAEKQLAVFILTKALSYVSGTKALTENNLTLLKDQLDTLPPGLRETTIHLNHEIACRNCVQFLNVLKEKTGLIVRTEFHKCYIEGERSRLRVEMDGNFTQVTDVAKQSGSYGNADVIDDELGLWDDADFKCHSVDQEGDSIMMIHSDPVTPVMSASQRSCSAPHLVQGPPCEKRGSPVYKEPPHYVQKYATFDITPPSHRFQALPTPQSHSRLGEISRTTTSPSPAGRPPVFGPENQTYSMSPSMSQEYEVEEILQAKEDNGKHLYLVRWKGYPHDNDTWEPFSNLTNATDAITKFWSQLGAAQSQIQEMDG